ncbi:MAG: LLM class F420-dependent oxidoreductase [Candidatus Rokubacteria bacterium]|nr:LLM class F420-dependent oxidoreductase [Candidatus Rokubacteria bacterium]MBI2491098.1 LLM class F420-dependent oxidoreductase [Candidatus Rokubacteria bacterium]
MKLGFGLPVGGAWATPDGLARVARAAERLGYHSLWTFQRLLYPVAPKNEYYGTPGAAWPEAFRAVLDPPATLAFVAALTTRVRLGVSVLLMPFYSPVVLAKQLATLDVLSRGRLDVGLGLGWSLDEYEAAGASLARRGARADEFVRCLKAMWADDPVEFAGEFYRVPRALVSPKPVQRPHPPILIGGYAEAVFRRAVRLGDGYTGGNIPLAELAPLVARLRALAREAGRDPEALPIVCRRALRGSLDEIRADVRRYAEAGVTELFLDPNFQPGGASVDGVLALMEALAPRRLSEN